MTLSKQNDDPRSIDNAIAMCDENIKRHNTAGMYVMGLGLAALVLLFGFAFSFAELSSKNTNEERLELLNDLRAKESVHKEVNSQNNVYTLKVDELKKQALELEKLKPSIPASKSVMLKWQLKKNEVDKEVAEAVDVLNEKIKVAITELEVAQENYSKHTITPILPKELMFGFFGVAVVLVSVFIGLYRLHQKEITQNEHHKLAFMRIRIAANNADQEGFKDEVRTALTFNAFSVPSSGGVFGKKEVPVESPLPGHPTTDLATGIVNKLLGQVEVVLQPKGK